jgi:serine/threonine protein kinase
MVSDEERRLQRWQGKNVVRYLGRVRHADGRTGFAMEEMDESLASIIAKRGPVPEVAALEYLSGAAAALLKVHRSGAGAFHGDVKPANILVTDSATKLADFGLARGGSGQTVMGGPHLGGTPGYMPPEGYASAAGDVYSLGVTLCALLAGVEAPGAPQAGASATSETAALLSAMLERDPQRRIRIEAVVAQLPVAMEAARRRRAKMNLQFAGVVLAAAAVVAGVVLLLRAKSR